MKIFKIMFACQRFILVTLPFNDVKELGDCLFKFRLRISPELANLVGALRRFRDDKSEKLVEFQAIGYPVAFEETLSATAVFVDDGDYEVTAPLTITLEK